MATAATSQLVWRNAADVDRDRPDNLHGAIRLDVAQLSHSAVWVVAGLTLGMFIGGALAKNFGVLGGAFVMYLMTFGGLWSDGHNSFGVSTHGRSGTLRNMTPLSRVSMVRGRYVLLFAGLTAIWAFAAIGIVVLTLTTDLAVAFDIVVVSALWPAFVVMELAAHPVTVRTSQGWGQVVGVGVLVLLVAAFVGFTALDGYTYALLYPTPVAVAAVALLVGGVYASYRSTLRGYRATDL